MSVLAPEIVQERLAIDSPAGNWRARRSPGTTSSPISRQPWFSSTRWRRRQRRPDHHPDIDIRYNKVRLGLISHDKGGLTERDMKMAQALSKLL